MRFRVKSTSGTKSSAERSQSGFTLAEVLAALLFMAIVIPVAVQGLRVASLAGSVADRRNQAARVAERLLAEMIVTTNWNKSMQGGTVTEGDRDYRWSMRNETWGQDGNMYSPKLVTVEVNYTVHSQNYSLSLSTLTPNSIPQ